MFSCYLFLLFFNPRNASGKAIRTMAREVSDTQPSCPVLGKQPLALEFNPISPPHLQDHLPSNCMLFRDD